MPEPIGDGIILPLFRSIESRTITNGLTTATGSGNAGLGGGIYTFGTMSLNDVTLSSNTAQEGGAIFNSGTLTVTNSNISGNTTNFHIFSALGGGIFNYGTLTVTSSTISNNTANGITTSTSSPGSGGGIATLYSSSLNPGNLTVTDSVISGNTAGGALGYGEGGGIYDAGFTMTVTNSTISGNTAGGPQGGQSGGIEVDTAINQGTCCTASTSTISGSTISGNTATGGAGAMEVQGPLTMVNSTISGNSATNFFGGAILVSTSGSLKLSFSTVAGNTSGANGSGIANEGNTTVKNSILASNTPGGDCFVFATHPAIVSGGYNDADDASCLTYFNQTGDMNSTPAGLDTNGLQLNSPGTTKTIALQSNSLNVNAVPLASCTDSSAIPVAVTVDQRGVSRPQGTNCDIGAYELVSTQTTATITFGTAPTPTYLGGNFTVGATTNSDGAITFSAMSGPCAFVSQTATTGTFSSSGAGTCVVKAETPATTNFTLDSNTQSVTIGQATATVTFGAAPTPTFPGSNFTVSATTNSDGALTFSAMSGPCALVSSTATTGTFSSSGTGSCVVKAATPATTNCTLGSNTQSVTIASASGSPTQMVTDLITTVQGMNIPGQGTSLTDQLNQVIADINTNNGLACRDLLLFINHVKAQTGKKISMTQANQLLTTAANIQTALGCS